MAQAMRGWVELDAARLNRVTAFNIEGGRPKVKITPAGSSIAKDTNYPPRAVSGSITIYGTEVAGFEFDYVGYCNDRSVHDMVRHYSATKRQLVDGVEFTTYSAPLPVGDGQLEVTVNWIGVTDDWE